RKEPDRLRDQPRADRAARLHPRRPRARHGRAAAGRGRQGLCRTRICRFRPDRVRARALTMILGIGTDLVDIRRIEQAIARHGDRFINRIYTEVERARAERKQNRIDTYAKRFAAKEACAKALGTGFRKGVFFRDMGVVNLPSGKPTLRLTGGALARLQAITPAGYAAQIDLALTDEYPLAQAFVIISALPKPAP